MTIQFTSTTLIVIAMKRPHIINKTNKDNTSWGRLDNGTETPSTILMNV